MIQSKHIETLRAWCVFLCVGVPHAIALAIPDMQTCKRNIGRWFIVVVFAIAMAWVESAVVFDLRTMVDRIEPYQPNPLPIAGALGLVELVRELATMIMLLTVGLLAGSTWTKRLGYSALTFGVWDIFYYIFLKIMCGWPQSLMDWDILFLLPLPWWGPVLAPVLIALLMIAWGTMVNLGREVPASRKESYAVWGMNAAGIAIGLYVFMADAIRVAGQGESAIRDVLPTWFNWPLFLVALALMAAPVVSLAIRLLKQDAMEAFPEASLRARNVAEAAVQQ